MTPIIVSARAETDEIDILEHLASVAGPRVALSYGTRFRYLYRLLSEHPESGAARPAVGRNVRYGLVAPYIIFYRHERGAVHVLRVVHGRRKITAAMLRKQSS